MSGGALPLPPAEPPDEDVQRALEELRLARREMADAAWTLRLLTIDQPPRLDAHGRRRQAVETEVAGLRVELWAVRVRRLEERARALGLRP